MTNKRKRTKGRKESGSFLLLPHRILRSTNYRMLSPYARALLLDIAAQYNGGNNGNLSCPFSYLKRCGWRSSKSTIQKSIRALEHFGMIVRVQHGGLNCGGRKRPNLYALSWLAIQKLGYSDGYTIPTDWKIGDIPGTWKLERSPVDVLDQKKQKVSKKNFQVQQQYRSSTLGVLVEGKF